MAADAGPLEMASRGQATAGVRRILTVNQELRQSIASSLDHAGRSVRLFSGLVLTAFVVTHLLNLALGLVSLSTMESWRHILMAPWRTLPGAILLCQRRSKIRPGGGAKPGHLWRTHETPGRA